jgi:putative ABC transport system substrate-binding protein
MRRREFIAGLGGAVAWPLAARAQKAVVPVIGFLNSRSPDDAAHLVAAFRGGLSEGGFVEGRNVTIEYRWALGQYDRLAAQAAELVHKPVAVLVSLGSDVTALAAKAATATIPIVFATAADPIELGLVASFNRPGGNITGVSFLAEALVAKRLELLHEIVPVAASIGYLVNPTSPQVEAQIKNAENAARILGVRLVILNASTPSEIEVAFAILAERRSGALMTAADPFFFGLRNQLAALAARDAVPAIYQVREMVDAGGLMSYGPDLSDVFRIVGGYVGRILKGDKPADLPVQQATKVELIINLKTAKTLGLTVPLALLGRADEVIE